MEMASLESACFAVSISRKRARSSAIRTGYPSFWSFFQGKVLQFRYKAAEMVESSTAPVVYYALVCACGGDADRGIFHHSGCPWGADGLDDQ